ncbi:MAG: hypothetical protein LC799_13845, partial [Actinobacteria bacterium]|nr:hypothetical protein [Actinomycetota bacterium]
AYDIVAAAARDAGVKIVGSNSGTDVLPPSDDPIPTGSSPGAYAYVDFFSPSGPRSDHSHSPYARFAPSHR